MSVRRTGGGLIVVYTNKFHNLYLSTLLWGNNWLAKEQLALFFPVCFKHFFHFIGRTLAYCIKKKSLIGCFTLFKIRVMKTCALKVYVKVLKKSIFALKNIILWLLRSQMHNFWYIYFYNKFVNMCPWGHKLTFVLKLKRLNIFFIIIFT